MLKDRVVSESIAPQIGVITVATRQEVVARTASQNVVDGEAKDRVIAIGRFAAQFPGGDLPPSPNRFGMIRELDELDPIEEVVTNTTGVVVFVLKDHTVPGRGNGQHDGIGVCRITG